MQGNLWNRAIPRAALIHLGLLGGAALLAALLAWPFGLGISAFGVLILYALLSVAVTAWRLRAAPEAETDEETRALEAFAAEPLGALTADTIERLAAARRAVGRDAAMYRPLDRLVRASRKIERRLALEPDLRVPLSRPLTRQFPLITTTAEQYVRLKDAALSDDETDRLIAAEGVLREAAERLEHIARDGAKPDPATIGLIRMDTNAELLAEDLSADMDAAAVRAAALRGAHALKQAAKSADERLASQLRGGAARIEAMAAEDWPPLRRFVGADLPGLAAAAEAFGGEPEDEDRLRAHLRRLAALDTQAEPEPEKT